MDGNRIGRVEIGRHGGAVDGLRVRGEGRFLFAGHEDWAPW
jgi:hypothetical protein